MSTGKLAAERTQRVLLELAAQPGNDICADCKGRNPRWASHNLGIFICVGCASIHRKMGTHISKVKSLTLDSWTKEQVETMKQIGNIKSNIIFNPNETRHPPPINAIDQERDSELEKFIRSKYEFKSYLDRSALVASKLGPSRSASSKLTSSKSDAKLSSSFSASTTSSSVSAASIAMPPPRSTPSKPASQSTIAPAAAVFSSPAKASLRSVSQPAPTPLNLPTQTQSPAPLNSSTSNNVVGPQAPTNYASLPLQYVQQTQVSGAPSYTSTPMSIPFGNGSSSSFLSTPSPYGNMSASPLSPFPSSFTQTTGISPGGPGRSMSLGTGLGTQMTGLSMNAGGVSPYQQPQHLPQLSPNLHPSPSPNPFTPQLQHQASGVGLNFGGGGMPASYNMTAQQPFMNQQPIQMFQPQAQQSLQVPGGGNPYMQTPSPQGSPFVTSTQYTNTTPSPFAMNQPLPYTGQPSPYAANQPLPQMQQQPSAQSTNPFTSWIAQGPQQNGNGYPVQQPWGGM